MLYDIRFEKAMKMLNKQLQEMKAELAQVEEMPLKGNKKKMLKQMQQIYQQLEEQVSQYQKSQEQSDFNNCCRMLEVFEPFFVINYNEICYQKGLELLHKTLDEIAEELEELELMGLREIKEEKIRLMEEIYEDLYDKVSTYAHSHDHKDFVKALDRIESLKSEFTLNYKKQRS